MGYRLVFRIFRKEKLPTDQLDSLLVYMMIGTVVGARLGHCLIYEPNIYLRDPIRILKVWEGGLASHGGAVGVMTAVWLWNRKHFHQPFLRVVDYLCIPTALVGSMIRVGNFFNSEIIGKPTNLPWAVVFDRVDQIPRHPSQLYESLAYFTTFLILMWVFFSGRYRQRNGLILGLFFILVFGARFGIEFLKVVQVNYERQLPLDLGQLLSIPFVILGVYFVVRALKSKTDVKAPKSKSVPVESS